MLNNKLRALPDTVQYTYMHWKVGYDPRELLTFLAFFEHRKALLTCDVDIRLPYYKKYKKSSKMLSHKIDFDLHSTY